MGSGWLRYFQQLSSFYRIRISCWILSTKMQYVGNISVAEALSEGGLFFWFLIEISTAFGTNSIWDNSVWHQLTVGNVACILLWAGQNMLLWSLVKNFSLHLVPDRQAPLLVRGGICPHCTYNSHAYDWKVSGKFFMNK